MRSGRLWSLGVWLWVGLVAAAFLAAALFQLQRAPFQVDMLDPTGWTYLVLGALIVSHRSGNVFGLLLMVSGTVGALPVFSLQELAPSDPGAIGPLWVWLDLLADLAFVPIVFPVLFLLLLFPTGRPPGPRWHWLIAFGLVLALGIWTLVALTPELAVGETNTIVRNPITPLDGVRAERFQAFIDGPDAPFIVLILIFAFACAAAPFVRYRSAGPVERAQVRWLLYAGAIFAVGFGLIAVTGFERRLLLPEVLWGIGILSVPVAVAIAILRHRLFDIDVIIRRTLQYGILTAILGGVYFGSVLLFQTVLGPLVGGADSPPVVIVTTLSLAALFNPLRIRVQRFIDRRFYRRKVDAERALADFAATARDEVDLEQLRAALFETVGGTLEPERMGLWIRPVGKGGSGAG